jgi:Na+/proline symporter
MSSIDSAMNSLAAVTLEDVFDYPAASKPVWISRVTSVLWGAIAVGSGLIVAESGALVLETINQIGSAFYGPVLAVFVLGVLAPRVTQRGVLGGLAAGLIGNAALALFAPESPGSGGIPPVSSRRCLRRSPGRGHGWSDPR